MTGAADSAQATAPGDVLAGLRAILVRVTGNQELAAVAAGTGLFGPPVGLDSLAGTLLLVEVQHQFGVDVAAEDLNLDCLATLATLAAFVAARRRGQAAVGEGGAGDGPGAGPGPKGAPRP